MLYPNASHWSQWHWMEHQSIQCYTMNWILYWIEPHQIQSCSLKGNVTQFNVIAWNLLWNRFPKFNVIECKTGEWVRRDEQKRLLMKTLLLGLYFTFALLFLGKWKLWALNFEARCSISSSFHTDIFQSTHFATLNRWLNF